MRGQRLLAINRSWLLDRLREVAPKKAFEAIPEDAEITDLQYLPLTQDILMTIASGAFEADRPGHVLFTHATFRY
jgi:hypothetical protein